MLKQTAAALLVLVFSFQSAFALLGARPMGMGGAFTALSDDASAPYWNPAGLALNPEVSAFGSTMLNRRNTYVGDNIINLKLAYEAEMNPFTWITGIGFASVLALEGAKYLADRGIVKKGWGREGEKVSREESAAVKVTGTEEVVSLKQEIKAAAKEAVKGTLAGAKEIAKETLKETLRQTRGYSLISYHHPWYTPDYRRPRYWEPRESESTTKAQFALGIGWLNDYNAKPQIDQNINVYTLTLASGFEERVSLGANLNLYSLERISTGIRGAGADLDLGIIAKPVEYISFGLATKGILTTDIKWQTDETTRYEMLVNAGLAVKPTFALTLAADAHNIFRQNGKDPTFHYGAESVLLPGVIARAGINDNSKTAGISAAAGPLIMDYAVLGGAFGRTQMIGASWRF